MDISNLGSLAGTLLKAGLPTLGRAVEEDAPFPFNLVAQIAVPMLFNALGVDPAAPNAVQQAQTQIAADPDAAVAKLQAVEQAAKDAADAANRELELQLADVQNARSTEVALAQAGSPLAKGAGYFTVAIVAMCVMVILIPFVVRDLDGQIVQMLLGWQEALKQLLVLAAGFWLGSSLGSHAKDAHLNDLAKAPTVQAQPGSNVHTGSVKGGR